MQMEAIERLVEFLGGLELKPNGTDDGHEVTDPWALRPGDHVIVSNGQIYHHAIYIGNLEGHSCPCFADMGREDKQEAPRLRIVEFPVFMRGYRAYYIVSYDAADEALARAKAVELALELVACPVSQVVNTYDVIKRNCECFAWFCKTGGQKQTSDAIIELIQKDLVRKDSMLMAALNGTWMFVRGLCSS
jgi:hypothetical protein